MKKKKMITLITALTLGMTSFATIPITTMAYEPIESILSYEHEGEGNVEIANVGAEIGFMIKSLKDGESIEYSLSDSDIAKIIYEDNTQVTVSCLKEGKTVLTAKSSDGQSFDVEITVNAVDTEPIAIEGTPNEEVKFGFEHEGEGNNFVENVFIGSEIGFMITGLKDGESVTYSLSDEEVGEIVYADNTQVTVACMKEGNTVLTAKSSDGQSFEVEIIVKSVDIEPIAIEGAPNEESKFGFEHEGEGNNFVENVFIGSEIGFMITGLKDGESVTYSLSDEEVGEIVYADNTQVTIACMKEGNTVLTAKSSDGQSFDVEITVNAVDTEPLAIEGTPNEVVNFGFEHEGDGDTFVEKANVGAEIGFTIIGLKDGEFVTYDLSDEEIAKIASSDNKQVAVSCLKVGKTVLTAKSSDGQNFEVEIIVLPVEKEAVPNEAVKGDANCDGHVDMADAVLIMQALANPDRFGENGTNENHITEQGMKNADISGDNDGVTAGDALAIQRKLLGLDD